MRTAAAMAQAAGMTLLDIDHVSFVVSDMDAAVGFYERVLGLHEVGKLGYGSMDRRFFHRLGASQLDRTICSTAGGAALLTVYGVKLGTPPQDFAHAGLVIAWGANVHDIALMKGAPAGRGSMHHVAITLQGGPAELRAFARSLRDRNIEVEMALDHKVSQSVYFRDPDANLIEVFVDQPRELWEHIPGAVTYGAPLSL